MSNRTGHHQRDQQCLECQGRLRTWQSKSVTEPGTVQSFVAGHEYVSKFTKNYAVKLIHNSPICLVVWHFSKWLQGLCVMPCTCAPVSLCSRVYGSYGFGTCAKRLQERATASAAISPNFKILDGLDFCRILFSVQWQPYLRVGH